MKSSGEIMAHVFALEDKCPFQNIGAVYCHKLYGKPYMNTGYAHKAMYVHKSDDYIQAMVKEREIKTKFELLKSGACDGKQTSNSRMAMNKPNTGNGWGSNVRPNYATDNPSGWSTGATTWTNKNLSPTEGRTSPSKNAWGPPVKQVPLCNKLNPTKNLGNNYSSPTGLGTSSVSTSAVNEGRYTSDKRRGWSTGNKVHLKHNFGETAEFPLNQNCKQPDYNVTVECNDTNVSEISHLSPKVNPLVVSSSVGGTSSDLRSNGQCFSSITNPTYCLKSSD